MKRPPIKQPVIASQTPKRPSVDKPGKAPIGEAVDDVGYCRPPLQHAWKKGRSGNPNGRPKGAKSRKTIISELMEGKLVRKIPDLKSLTTYEAILLKLTQKALAGDPKATTVILNHYHTLKPDEVASDGDITDDDEVTYKAFIDKIKSTGS